jgi:hypothetical protein
MKYEMAQGQCAQQVIRGMIGTVKQRQEERDESPFTNNQGPVIQRNFVTNLALVYLGIKSFS